MKEWIAKKLQGDYQIWVIVLLLSLLSVLIVYSATGTLAYKSLRSASPVTADDFLLQNARFLLIGLACLWVCHKINYMIFARPEAYWLLWISLGFILYSHFFGPSINNAARWFTLPGTSIRLFQPSDFAKIALIANLAQMLSKRQKTKYDQQSPRELFRLFMPMIFWCGAICGSIALSNGSTAVLLASTCFLLMFIGRVPMRYLLMMVLICTVLGGIGLAAGSRLPSVKSRLETFFAARKAEKDLTQKEKDARYQKEQGYVAIAQGGLIGRGPGRSLQRNYLPFPFSDFVFATIIEEYGLIIGGLGVLGLYIWLLARGMKSIARTDRPFGGLLSAGLTFSIVIQAMVNMMVVVGLFPTTGQTLPMISMGGSSQIATCISIGIILSVSKQGIPERIPK